jgi:hypothetical protein
MRGVQVKGDLKGRPLHNDWSHDAERTLNAVGIPFTCQGHTLDYGVDGRLRNRLGITWHWDQGEVMGTGSGY